MSAQTLDLLLYVPFVLVILITGIIYLITGYKRGLWRSLLSLGATVTAAGCALLFSNLLSSLISTPLMNLIPKDTFSDLQVLSGVAQEMVHGLLQVVAALVLFFVFLVIFLIVFKILANNICRSKLTTDKKTFKWAGFGVRVLDTLLVTILVLLPLYGTLSTSISPAKHLAHMTSHEEDPLVVTLTEIEDHPLIQLYQFGFTRWITGSLTNFNVGNATVNVTEMAETLDGTLERLNNVINCTPENRKEACQELNEYLKDHVLEEDWFFEVVSSASEDIKTQLLENDLSEEEKKQAEQYLDLLDMDAQEFESNGHAVSDFLTYALEHNIFESENIEETLTDETVDKFTDLLYHSPQTVAFQKLMLKDAATTMLIDNRTSEGQSYDEVKLQAEKDAADFVDTHFDEIFTSEEEQKKAAKAFASILLDGSSDSLLDAFAKHPSFGREAVEKLIPGAFAEEEQ